VKINRNGANRDRKKLLYQRRKVAASGIDADGFDLDEPGRPADGRFQQDHRNARGRRFSTSLRIAVFPQLPVYVFIRYGVSLW